MRTVFTWILAGMLAIGFGLHPTFAADRCRAERDAVVLLHGLGRTPRSMKRIEETLAGAGYEVHNLGYPSRDFPVEELAAAWTPRSRPAAATAIATCTSSRIPWAGSSCAPISGHGRSTTSAAW